MQSFKIRLRALIRNKLVTVPLLTGAGSYLLTLAYSPGRWVHIRPRVSEPWFRPAELDPLSVAIGVALLTAALVILLPRDSS